ncbi:MAG TPA: FecR domain-containing protein [Chitinophaga sp.]|uniref:FecR family protein n=1 Tax=Chitinophaga sp. TaxID=1869181 RepID=UPI002DBE5745|nr:FecR domain-containing protein [Chitinophaga sp.]HEU4555550.1 FecR domain-containing protein [Chitinophaga sp.]
MMKRDPCHIHALMTSRLAGDISETDALYLQQLIDTDPEVLAAWKEFREKFLPEDVQDGFQRYEAGPWIPATTITGKKKSRISIRKLIAYASLGAALITGLVTGAYQWYIHGIHPRTQPVAGKLQPANSNNISLQLANGQTINLSQVQGNIQVANTKLKNTGKALSYGHVVANDAAAGESMYAMNTLTVPIGKSYSITLSDGSLIWLNSASTLQFPLSFSRGKREVTINGEAYLEVTKQAGNPFLVNTPHGTVQVLGTSFNVNAYDSGVVKVALVTGAVKFTSGKNEVTIHPGNEAVYKADKGITIQPFDEDETLGWRKGKYYFSDATLGEIVNVLPRWYGTNVLIDDPQLARERFAGVMDRNKPITAFLDNLGNTRKIRYYFDNKGVLHLQ